MTRNKYRRTLQNTAEIYTKDSYFLVVYTQNVKAQITLECPRPAMYQNINIEFILSVCQMMNSVELHDSK